MRRQQGSPHSPLERIRRFGEAVPLRWRLALGSALLTCLILTAFSVVLHPYVANRLWTAFDQEIDDSAQSLAARIDLSTSAQGRTDYVGPDLSAWADNDPEAVRVYDAKGKLLAESNPRATALLGAPALPPRIVEHGGYRVVTIYVRDSDGRKVGIVQAGQSAQQVRKVLDAMALILAVIVLVGTGVALLGGLAIARRAIRPVSQLTRAARLIERTRDPRAKLPKPKAQDEISELAHTLDDMLAALSQSRSQTMQALQSQREFVANASHELRTPLTSMLANLDLLQAQAGDEDEEKAEMIEASLRSARRMRRLVEDLLFLARSDSAEPAREKASVADLRDVVRNAVAEMEPISDGHEVRLTLGSRPCPVEAFKDDIYRLALNLITNAIRHTPQGTTIRVAVDRPESGVQLDVSDDGPGIPDEMRGRVFERFIGADRDDGTGLGLAIVKAIVVKHGGTIHLTSESGTHFVVVLPVADGES